MRHNSQTSKVRSDSDGRLTRESSDGEDENQWSFLYESDNEEEEEEEHPMDDGEAFFQEMKILLLNRTITVQQFCIIIYHAARAQVDLERYAKYGRPPNLQSGKYQRHLRKIANVC